MRRLGASRTALIDCLYSPFVILFSFMTAGETIGPMAIPGGALILGSVVVSSLQGSERNDVVEGSAIFLKEPMTRLKLLAVAMAFAGAAVIFY